MLALVVATVRAPVGSEGVGFPGETVTSRCLQVDVDQTRSDELSGAFWAAGATGIQELDLNEGRMRLVVGFDAADEVALCGAAVELGHSVDVFDADYDGWLDAWRPFARPVEAPPFFVHPPWEEVEVPAGLIAVPIDPGRAFGQGAHPTTRMVLRLAAELTRPGDRVLDVGCGSGVLGVGAALVGAAEVIALDIDPQARSVTQLNAAANGVSDVVSVIDGGPDELAPAFDLVLANILAPVLVDLAPDLLRLAGRDGTIVLSGLLADQQDAVVAAYEGELAVTGIRADGDWRALVLR